MSYYALSSPREAVAAPSLAVFKVRLDGALRNLVWWKESLPMVGLNWMICKVPFQPKSFYSSSSKLPSQVTNTFVWTASGKAARCL